MSLHLGSDVHDVQDNMQRELHVVGTTKDVVVHTAAGPKPVLFNSVTTHRHVTATQVNGRNGSITRALAEEALAARSKHVTDRLEPLRERMPILGKMFEKNPPKYHAQQSEYDAFMEIQRKERKRRELDLAKRGKAMSFTDVLQEEMNALTEMVKVGRAGVPYQAATKDAVPPVLDNSNSLVFGRQHHESSAGNDDVRSSKRRRDLVDQLPPEAEQNGIDDNDEEARSHVLRSGGATSGEPGGLLRDRLIRWAETIRSRPELEDSARGIVGGFLAWLHSDVNITDFSLRNEVTKVRAELREDCNVVVEEAPS